MGFELESEEGKIEIDFDRNSIRGECKAKDFKKQFQKVMEAFE